MNHDDIDHRFNFHPADTTDKQAMHETTRAAFRDLGHWLNDVLPEGREKSLAVTKLEEALMWANAAIARNVDA